MKMTSSMEDILMYIFILQCEYEYGRRILKLKYPNALYYVASNILECIALERKKNVGEC